MREQLKLSGPSRRRLEKLDRKRPGADVRARIRVILKACEA